jgi:hypothetical protein
MELRPADHINDLTISLLFPQAEDFFFSEKSYILHTEPLQSVF